MKRLVRASKKDSEDCKKLLRLMGVPYVEASAGCSSLACLSVCVPACVCVPPAPSVRGPHCAFAFVCPPAAT